MINALGLSCFNGIESAIEGWSIAEAPSIMEVLPFSSNVLGQKKRLLVTSKTGSGFRRMVDFAKGLPSANVRWLEAYRRDTGLQDVVDLAKGVVLVTGETFVVSMKKSGLSQLAWSFRGTSNEHLPPKYLCSHPHQQEAGP